jgi:hypothetical protein
MKRSVPLSANANACGQVTESETKENERTRAETTEPGTDVRIFKNSFAAKIGEKIGVFNSKKTKLCKNLIITVGF